ncbi:MarR family winged helix-turn-helix transcriptional regulator [Kroppenstedtia eburnea]|nr:MarR family transcriptional regulator [Kroppenstedtia eburnea]QKI81162.1 MarR family transcriptional regulator [Kroppenstedtia eburnea]
MGEDQINELIFLLRQSGRTFRQRAFLEVKKYNLTVPQSIVLRTLAYEGKQSLAGLSEQAGMSTSSLSGIVDRLEGMGYVERQRDQTDRRVVWIDLTPAGKAFIKGVPALNPNFLKSRLLRLPPEDIQLLILQLRKFIDILEDPESPSKGEES